MNFCLCSSVLNRACYDWKSVPWRYVKDLVLNLVLLASEGNFRIWNPVGRRSQDIEAFPQRRLWYPSLSVSVWLLATDTSGLFALLTWPPSAVLEGTNNSTFNTWILSEHALKSLQTPSNMLCDNKKPMTTHNPRNRGRNGWSQSPGQQQPQTPELKHFL